MRRSGGLIRASRRRRASMSLGDATRGRACSDPRVPLCTLYHAAKARVNDCHLTDVSQLRDGIRLHNLARRRLVKPRGARSEGKRSLWPRGVCSEGASPPRRRGTATMPECCQEGLAARARVLPWRRSAWRLAESDRGAVASRALQVRQHHLARQKRPRTCRHLPLHNPWDVDRGRKGVRLHSMLLSPARPRKTPAKGRHRAAA